MKLNNKKKLGLLLLLIFLVIIVFFVFRKDKLVEIQNEVRLDEVVKNINDIQKNIALNFQQGNNGNTASMFSASLNAWEAFVGAFKDKQPEEYGKTKDWDEKLLNILNHERRANELFLEKNFIEAEREKKLSDEIYKKIKKENNILEISDEMLMFYDSVEKVVKAPTKKEIIEELPVLKLRFTILKEVGVDEEYDNFIEKMENKISELDIFLDGPDFKKAQLELEKVFMEIYMGY